MSIPRVGVLALCLGLVAVSAAAWPLVTKEEDRRDDTAPHKAAKDVPGPPTIELVRPDTSNPIKNPVTVDIQFSAGPGRTIDMRSFRATYGWLRLDITKRLLQHATETANSLSATDIDLPRGDHSVTLSIADTLGKRASRTFRLSIAR